MCRSCGSRVVTRTVFTEAGVVTVALCGCCDRGRCSWCNRLLPGDAVRCPDCKYSTSLPTTWAVPDRLPAGFETR